jgi:hypothetical protein
VTISPELLAAYADGELAGEAAQAVEAEIAKNAELRAVLVTHRGLRAKLTAHFAPVAAEPVPDRLSAAVAAEPARSGVAGLAAEAGSRRASPMPPRRWARIALPALAASLVLVFLGVRYEPSRDYADRALAETLDRRLAAEQTADGPLRILLSFRDKNGEYCRGFSAESGSGIACRDGRGWRLKKRFEPADGRATEYRQAGSAALMAAIQDMADGPPLDADAEAEAAKRGWRPAPAR